MKTLYSLITFQTLNDIFEQSKVNLTSKDKMLYINCLYASFKDKEATVENLKSFDIQLIDIKNYITWKSNFERLNNAKLIQICDDKIIFLNVWSNFININNDSNNHNDDDEDEIEKKLLQNRSMIDVVGMKNKLTIDQINHLIKIFVKEQKATETKHKDIADYSKHFIYWVKINISNVEFKQSSTVKSKSKLLGM